MPKTKIYCGDFGCMYNNNKGVCTAKKITLSWSMGMSLQEGLTRINQCKTRQPSKEQHELEKRTEERRKAMK